MRKEGSTKLPHASDRDYLGMFATCHGAVRKAREKYAEVDGCYFCSRDCHTR